MPLSRYQIRNEYSLADPELYRAADKDDPEALLEGAAMAGLVGVLRQLGDLAEFAAEIFHDLHEEVMVTAARGHSLMARVQQLEAEVPTIEKAFLSQTSHSSFFYHPGVDWHPNIRMDQSLITRGDLPRFVMDSYEECRGPPRLFLLDKFDVAGAGACLKRYTDPSFFKVETSSFGIACTDVQREKRSRKAKKKGSRWRNGETPEALPTSHAKLHQLFLEERIQNGISDPARRVKLKRRLNGFPFDTKSGKSYMEKFFESPSPDHKEVHDILVDSSPPALPSNSTYKPGFEIVKISISENEFEERSLSPSSPANEETLGLSVNDLNEVPSGTEISGVLKSDPGLDTYDISNPCLETCNSPPTLEKVDSEKEITVDGGSRPDDSVDDYQSDDIASEIDNYMDALTTMESEMDTDSELKTKNDSRYVNSRRQASDLDVSDEQPQALSSESQSMGHSTLSDDGNSSSKKEISSFSYSDTHSTSAENTPSDGEVSSNVFPRTEIHEAEITSTSMVQQSINEEDSVSQNPGSAVSSGSSIESVEVPHHSSKLGDSASSSSPSDSPHSYGHTGAIVKESASLGPETGETLTDVSLNLPYAVSPQQKIDGSPVWMSDENQLKNDIEFKDIDTSQNLPDLSYISVPSQSKDESSLKVSTEKELEDELDKEDLNTDEIVASVSDVLNHPADSGDENSCMLPYENQHLDDLHGGDANLNDNASFASNLCTVTLPHIDDSSHRLSAENLPVNEVDDEDPNSHLDGSVSMSNTMEAATEMKSSDHSTDGVCEIGYEEGHCLQNSDDSQIGQQNSVIPSTEEQPLDPTHCTSTVPGDIVFEVNDVNLSAGETAVNTTPREDAPSEFDESLVLETIADIPEIWSSKEGMSYCKEEHFDDPSGTEDVAVRGEAASNSNLQERESAEEPALLAQDHAYLDEIDAGPVNMVAASVSADNNGTHDADGSYVDLKNWQDRPFSGFEDEHNGLETDEACIPDGHREEDVHQQIFALSVLNSVLGNVLNNDCSESQVGGDVFEAESELDLDKARKIQPSLEQNEQESLLLKEKVNSLPKQLEESLPSEANAEPLTQLQKIQYSNHVGPFDASSETLPANLPSKPLVSEFSPQGGNKIDLSEQPIDPSSSFLPRFFLLPDASQIVEDMPPMPPLPPVQWRIGKLQPASPSHEKLHRTSAFPPLLQSRADQDQPLNSIFPQSGLGHEKSPPVSEQPTTKVVHSSPLLAEGPSVAHHGDSKENSHALEGSRCTHTSLELPGLNCEMLQTHIQAGGEEQSRLNSLSHLPAIDAASPSISVLLHKECIKPLNQVAPGTSLVDKELGQNSALSEENAVTRNTKELLSRTENEQPQAAMPASADALGLSVEKPVKLPSLVAQDTSLEDKEIGQGSAHSEENLVSDDTASLPSKTENEQPQHAMQTLNDTAHSEENLVSDDTASLPSKTENEQPQHAMQTLEGTLVWPAAEIDKPNGHRGKKLPLPRNPLIDAVAAHDKSKLRKVTDRVRPQMQVEERDSLLEQIRAKSFNLKPAVVTRPSMQGPRTNLKVAAILEKAKTIRQALAGSDEDDEDSWSDS